MTTTYLIVNADDFGWTPGINEGVVQAHTAGIVTSTTLMVRQPAAAAAARAARACPDLSVGLHVDLAHWSYREGEWEADYERVDSDDPAAVAHEVEQQLHEFRRLTGADPTHLDGHQHVQRSGAARSVLRSVAEELGVPLRLHGPIAYCGGFFGQDGRGHPYPEGLKAATLLELVAGLAPGWHELSCHPGLGDDAPDGYRAERGIETAVLCDPEVRAGIVGLGVALRSFADWNDASGGLPKAPSRRGCM